MKKIFVSLLSAVIFLSSNNINAVSFDLYTDNNSADVLMNETAANGSCGENLIWTLDSGILTINGIGEMTETPWTEYAGQITSIIIKDGVASVKNNAFENFSVLTNISIPDSVKSIGDYSFHNCPKIKSISIPYGVTDIGNDAFSRCYSLANISIPQSVTSIGEWAFSRCYKLTEFVIPKSVNFIGDDAFSYCSGLTSISIPDGIASIGDWTFAECSELKNIYIPESVAYIGYSAFKDCTKLTDIYYGGTSKKWNNLKIEDNNDVLQNVQIHYESTAESLPTPNPPAITPMKINIPVCDNFNDKISGVFEVDKNGNAALNIEQKDPNEKIQTTAYAAYFDNNGRLTDVKIFTPDKNGQYSFEIINGNYKLMLWNGMNPIINAIKQ